MRSWRHWLRREVFFPALSLTLAGFALIWLGQKLTPLIKQFDQSWLRWTFWISVAVYFLFAYVTLRHVLSTYTLERFDPGDPASVRRLSRISRFNFPPANQAADSHRQILEQILIQEGFSQEADHGVIGHVMHKATPSKIPLLPTRHDRIFLVEKTPLNVFIVDFAIRDTLAYLADQNPRTADRNVLIFMTHEPQVIEAASAAAGVVNFLGKTEDGTLGTLLLDSQNSRLYFPIDQTLIPFAQRRYLKAIRRKVLLAVNRA